MADSMMADEREHKASGGPVMKNSGEEPGHEKRGGGVRRPRRAAGGSTSKVQAYNAQGSNEAKEAEDESEDFKKGGHVAKKAGGMVEGMPSQMRGDKAPRGRERHAAGGRAGGTVWSSGRTMNAPKDDKAGRGHQSVSVPSEQN